MDIATRTLRQYLASLPGGNAGSLVAADMTLRSAEGFATAMQGQKADSALQGISAGPGIGVDATDPQWPIVSSTVVPGGQVDAVVAGANMEVDDTDPANPVVGLDAATQTAVEQASTSLQSVVAGINVEIDNTDPRHPVINASGGEGGGTVSSVGLTVPTGFEVSGSPITITGTFEITYASGYQGYTTAEATKLGYITVTGAINLDNVVVDGDFASNGLLARTAAGTYASRTVSAGTGVAVTNGDGVSGNPTVALSSGAQASLALADSAVQPAAIADMVTAGASFATDNRLLRSDGTGKGAQASGVTLSDANVLSGAAAVYASLVQGGQLSMPDTGQDHAALFQMGTNLSAARTYTLAMPDGSYTYTFPGASVTLAALNLEDQVLTGGARVTVKDLGNLSGNTITPHPGDRPHQKLTNNGAGTIAPGSNYGDYYLDVINTTGAGAITTSGWTKVAGDSFDTTTTSKFRCGCSVTADMSTMQILKVA